MEDLRRFLFKLGKSGVDDAGLTDAAKTDFDGEPDGDEASPQQMKKLQELLSKLGVADSY